MKKISFYVIALVASALASCSNEENIVSPAEEAEQFVAVIAEGESRTSLGDKSVLWTYDAQQDKTDKISIFRKNGYNTKYYLSSVDVQNNVATFTYSDYYTSNSPEIELSDKKNYAVYPYNDNITIAADGAVTVEIPATQTIGEGPSTFDPAAAFMFAVSGNQNLSFKNANTLMKFELKTMPGETYTLNSIELSSENKKLNGKATIKMENEEPKVEFVDGAVAQAEGNNNSLTLNCGASGIEINDPKSAKVLYLVVTPGTYVANDLTLTFNVTYGGDTKSIEKTISKEVTLDRNSIETIKYTLGSEDFTGEIKDFGSTSQDAAQ